MLIDVCAVGSMPFPADKLAAVNKTVELPEGKHLLSLDDGKNYVSQFEVFHQLHCLVCEGHDPLEKHLANKQGVGALPVLASRLEY